jgi:hypothetical protein
MAKFSNRQTEAEGFSKSDEIKQTKLNETKEKNKHK